jgi:colicin import membrane protein
MFRRNEVARHAGRPPAAQPVAEVTTAGNFAVDQQARPNFSGDLNTLLTTVPVFRTALRGYDRLQVDNYVTWAETELRLARRETDDLVERYGQASAELEISRRLLARSPEGQEMSAIAQRMSGMLQMAADEAAELKAAGEAGAEQIRADARREADARLRKAHEIKQMAVDTSDRLRETARQLRAEAAAELDRARAEGAAELDRARAGAAQLRAEAQAERERLVAEAVAELERAHAEAAAERERARAEAAAELERADAEAVTGLDRARAEAAQIRLEAEAERERLDRDAAAARLRAEQELTTWIDRTRAAARREQEEVAAAAEAALAEAQGELAELQRRRDRARDSLLRLNEQLGVALETVTGLADETVLSGPGRPATV